MRLTNYQELTLDILLCMLAESGNLIIELKEIVHFSFN